MKGWVTWLAAACTAGLGVVSIINGDTLAGFQQLAIAGGMIGIGRKIEKQQATAEAKAEEPFGLGAANQSNGSVRPGAGS